MKFKSPNHGKVRVRNGSGEGLMLVRRRSGDSEVKSQKFSYKSLTLVLDIFLI